MSGDETEPCRHLDTGGRVDLMKCTGYPPSSSQREALPCNRDPERTIPTERPLTCDFAATAIVELLDGAPFDPAAILAALREPVFPLGLGQQCCLFSEPVAGRIVEGVDSLEQAVATVTPGRIYLPADVSTGELGDIYATIPAGRDWKSRQHGGSTVYRVRSSI
jgi:hypothetical protein